LKITLMLNGLLSTRYHASGNYLVGQRALP